MNQKNLETVDWSTIPTPLDDGAADHLLGMSVPNIALPSTKDGEVYLAQLKGWSVIFFYPMTGRPDSPLPEEWDSIPGARGCTPQSCSFRNLSQELASNGVSAIYGISTQSTEYQLEAATRLHLPFALLSDAKLHLTEALLLPTMEVSGMTLIRRLTLILHDSTIEHVFFPVFPPDRNAADVLNFMKNTRHRIVNIDMENE